jgi:hypothetical protein
MWPLRSMALRRSKWGRGRPAARSLCRFEPLYSIRSGLALEDLALEDLALEDLALEQNTESAS